MDTTYLRPAAWCISLMKRSSLRDVQSILGFDVCMPWLFTYQINYSLVLSEELVFCVYLDPELILRKGYKKVTMDEACLQ